MNKDSQRERVDKQKSTSLTDLKERSSSDKGELSQALIWISAFAVAGITAIGGITAVSLTKGEDAANCINNANTFKSGSVDRETCATEGVSNGGGTLTPGDGGNVTPGEPIDTEDDNNSIVDYTPDECFEMSGSTITKYLIVEKPILCTQDVVIPEEINGNKVLSLLTKSFSRTTYEGAGKAGVEFCDDVPESHKVNSVIFPNNLKTIGNRAFECNNLSEIDFTENIETIHSLAFKSNNLTEVTLPDEITRVTASAFENNDIKNVYNVHNNIQVIEPYAFMYNKIESIDFGNNVSRIGWSAFSYNNLTNVTIPDKVQKVEINAFRGNNISSVEIPDSVTAIERGAFFNNNILFLLFKKK